MNSACYRVKLSAHVQREVAAKPELVQIETAYRSPKERQPDALARNEYTDLEELKDEDEKGAEIIPCEASKTAIVVYGEGAGTTRTVCTDPDCPVHHPRRVIAIDPEAEARQHEIEKEQAKRKRLLKRRTESFNRILDNAPATFNGPQLRVLLRALIHIDPFDFIDDVAAHFVGDNENNQQGAEDVLLSVIDGLADEKLPGFALRLALTGHVDVPREGELDHLAEVEKLWSLFSPRRHPRNLQPKQRESQHLQRRNQPRKRPARKSRRNHGWGQQWPHHSRGGDMLQFTYKLKIIERVKGKCSRHPRYNPEKDGRAGIRGGCSCCFSLYDLYQARIALDAAQREFIRRAAPWTRTREPRGRKAINATQEPHSTN